MINCSYIPQRNQYLIKTSEKKAGNVPLNEDDFLNIGYMAGRFGLNLKNPNEPNNIYKDEAGTYVKINSCCAHLFESNLKNAGIKFDRLA